MPGRIFSWDPEENAGTTPSRLRYNTGKELMRKSRGGGLELMDNLFRNDVGNKRNIRNTGSCTKNIRSSRRAAVTREANLPTIWDANGSF